MLKKKDITGTRWSPAGSEEASVEAQSGVDTTFPVGLPEIPSDEDLLIDPGTSSFLFRAMEDGLVHLDRLAQSLGGEPVPLRQTMQYDVEGGTCIGAELHVNHEFAIQLVGMSRGAYLPMHVHEEETELLMVLSGSLRLDVKEGGKVLQTRVRGGSSYRLEPGMVHAVEALRDCRFLAIGSPPIKGYPGV